MISINLVKNNNATIVSVTRDGVKTEQFTTHKQNILAENPGGNLRFPESDYLSDLAINFNNIDAATKTLLGNPANNYALATALATNKFFQDLS